MPGRALIVDTAQQWKSLENFLFNIRKDIVADNLTLAWIVFEFA